MKVVEYLTVQIEECDRELGKVAKARYEVETTRLRQIKGVGPLTALTYILTIEDGRRFQRSRDVGSYLGLVPKSKQSGSQDPEMRISKARDGYLRKLLVQCGQYILSRKGPDTDLKR